MKLAERHVLLMDGIDVEVEIDLDGNCMVRFSHEEVTLAHITGSEWGDLVSFVKRETDGPE